MPLNEIPRRGSRRTYLEHYPSQGPDDSVISASTSAKNMRSKLSGKQEDSFYWTFYVASAGLRRLRSTVLFQKYKGGVQKHRLSKEEQCTNDRAVAAAEEKQLPCINQRVSLAHCIHWRTVPAQQPPATTGRWGKGDRRGWRTASDTARLCTVTHPSSTTHTIQAFLPYSVTPSGHFSSASFSEISFPF